MSDGSPLPSICFIRAAESYPKSQMIKDDPKLLVPFQELAGESVEYLGGTNDGVILALSNYRIYLSKTSTTSETYVPLGLIESVQVRDLFHLIVNCKDASTVRCSFQYAEQCSEWQRRIQSRIGVPEKLEELFAFPFYLLTCDPVGNKERNTITNGIGTKLGALSENAPGPVYSTNEYSNRLQRAIQYESDFKNEIARLGFDLKGSWRISSANIDFKLCPSYPQKMLVPCGISDEILHNVANFRGSRRLPAVVWRHQKSGAVLARCSQPEVGWLGWRNYKDELLLKALADVCAFDRGEHARRSTQQAKDTSGQASSSGKSSPSLEDSSHEELPLDEIRKILIVDARSYTSAVTNRARGGGCECIEYYPCAEIEFMNLGNIHAIRKSFHAVRQLCASSPEDPNWLGQLEKTMWMQHLSGLLGASMTVVHTIENKGRPVLVHCSDGWDRTPQIVATAQLCLDPFYRTVEGFRVLVEREWLSFGHKFSDRSGNGPNSDELNERCPVFLQWLDMVHQIHSQYPCSFEFSLDYLIKLAQHSLSCLFGTFLCNSLKERIDNSIFDRTFSVWPFLADTMYRNPLYKYENEKVLWPAHTVRFLHFWSEVYLGSLGNKNGTDLPLSNSERQCEQHIAVSMTKTRSSGDLTINELGQSNLSRRSSDPNLTVESNVTDYLNLSSNSMFDIRSGAKECTLHVNNNIEEELKDTTKDECKQYENENEQTETKVLANDYASKNDMNSATVFGFLEALQKSLETNDKNDAESLQHSTQRTDNTTTIDDSLVDHQSGKNDNTDDINGGLWNDPVDTSTDTLIPTEPRQPEKQNIEKAADIDMKNNITNLDINAISSGKKSESTCVTNKMSQSYCNLPKVHAKPSNLRYLQTVNGSHLDQWDNFPANLNLNASPALKENCIIDNSKENSTKHIIDGVSGGSGALGETSNRDMPDSVHNASLPLEMATITNPRRRNTLSSSSSRDNANLKFIDNTCTPHFPSSGLNSLPPTPQGLQDRTQFTITCPDGLTHALSEQNIRLHQIVQEHKLREDILLREINGMRLALLHKACPSCNSVVSNNVEQESGLDIVENASTCSWEAVEERSGPSSYTTSSIQEKKGSSVLWVPDHAVSRCSHCQIEFWLGRRKHHCRSCGEIFCADCSEYWAPLPYEKLFNPVRLCASCYTTVMTLQQENRLPSDCMLTNEVAKPSPHT